MEDRTNCKEAEEQTEEVKSVVTYERIEGGSGVTDDSEKKRKQENIPKLCNNCEEGKSAINRKIGTRERELKIVRKMYRLQGSKEEGVDAIAKSTEKEGKDMDKFSAIMKGIQELKEESRENREELKNEIKEMKENIKWLERWETRWKET